jgi:hypothetical protein
MRLNMAVSSSSIPTLIPFASSIMRTGCRNGPQGRRAGRSRPERHAPFKNACVSCETQTRGCKRLSSPCPLTGIFRAIDEHPARRIIAKNKRGHSPVPAQKRKYGSSPRAFRRTILEEKDHGAWSIPKGLISFGEAPLDTAKREFEEETGHRPRGEFTSLGEANHPRGKTAHVWAVEDGWNPDELKSNMFQME